MKKLILGALLSLVGYVANAQVITAQSLNTTQNFHLPQDTSVAAKYLYELRIIPSTGLMVYWNGTYWKTTGAVVTTPSWYQTLLVNDTSHKGVVYDTVMNTGNPVEKVWAEYLPLHRADTATVSYTFFQFSGSNNGSWNEVMGSGWNLNSGGGARIAGKPGLGEMWEQNYQIDPSGHGHRYVEKHEVYVDRDGDQKRLSSYTIDADTRTISFYHTVDNFDLHNTITKTPYFSVFNSTHLTNMSMVLQSDQAKYFNIAAEFEESPTANSFSISAPGDKDNRSFKLLNFNYARIPSSVAVFDEHNSSSVISLQDSGGTNLSQWKGTPTNAEINTPSSSGKYIVIAPEQVDAIHFYSTNAAFLVPLYVGSGTYSGSNKAVIDNGDKVTSLRVNNFDGSGGNHYGTTSIVSGGGSNTNIGAYLWGFNGGSGNYDVQFGPLMAGAGNYTMYANGTAVSHLAGWLSIGPNPAEYPSQALHVYGKIRVDTLLAGTSTSQILTIDGNVIGSVDQSTVGGIRNSATLDFSNTSDGSSSSLTVTVTGAVDGDQVSIGVPNAATTPGVDYFAYVSASNTVTIQLYNHSGSSFDPPSATFKVRVFK